jgi:anthranilate phosphoribosyltransferase
MKFVAPVRKELGVKTFFNMLGPLVNPAKPKKQMIGVFNLELARMYQYLFQEETMQYSIVHALDGFDEISLTSDCKIISNREEKIIDAAYFGFEKVDYKNLSGGNTIESASTIFMEILNGKGTDSQNQVVLANAAIAIKTHSPQLTIEEGVEKAKDSLFGLKALQSFNTLKQLS